MEFASSYLKDAGMVSINDDSFPDWKTLFGVVREREEREEFERTSFLRCLQVPHIHIYFRVL